MQHTTDIILLNKKYLIDSSATSAVFMNKIQNKNPTHLSQSRAGNKSTAASLKKNPQPSRTIFNKLKHLTLVVCKCNLENSTCI